MTINTEKIPYTVEVADIACPRCGNGGTWDVVGPYGIALGVSFHEKSAAQEWAYELSLAYLAGAQDAIKKLQGNPA